MAKGKRKKHQNLAQRKLIKPASNLKGLLVHIGKPLYFFLTYFVVIAIFLTYVLGQVVKTLSSVIYTLFTHILLYLPKIRPFNSKLIIRKIHFFFNYLKKFKKSKYKRVTKRIYPPTGKLLISYLKFPRLNLPKIKFSKTLSAKIGLVKIFFAFVLVLMITISSLTLSFWHFVLKDLPSVESLKNRPIIASTKIYDRNGKLLFNIYKDENRTPIPLEDIPLRARLATLAIEDAEFYNHPGFSIRGITRAVIRNLTHGEELVGGSTITQQLVKNTLLTSEKTLKRKLQEIVLAIKIEQNFSKDEILEMYLNEVGYGGTAYGIQEASRQYFGKDVDKINLAEAALLAGLPKSPTYYSPFGNNPNFSRDRQKQVLRLMKINKFITQEQYIKALDMEINLTKVPVNIKAPHFVMYVRKLLEDKYSKALVEQGGLNITTTLDYSIQELAENVVREEVKNLKSLNVTNASAIVANPKTGEILAMVGSKDYFDEEIDGNVNVNLMPRQPGSSIKVVNYALALSNGYTPATIINDSPAKFLVEGQPQYTPKNYDGKFRGNISLRSALAESRNVPAVKVLADQGVENMMEMGRKMGITTWNDPKNYGLSLTLGGGEVKLVDLAQVYATIANYGRKSVLYPVVSITNYEGEIIEKNSCLNDTTSKFKITKELVNTAKASGKENVCKNEQILDPGVAFIITDILKDNEARSPAFGSNSLLNIAGHKEVAVKTGTSNNLRDNLAIGYNQDYLVAVWVGNNDNSPMARVASGITGATPIFNKIMTSLLAQKSNHDWEVPEGLVQLPICPYTATLACDGCPVKMEWFIEGTQPQTACDPEWFVEPTPTQEIKTDEDKPDEKKNIPSPFNPQHQRSIFDLRNRSRPFRF